MKTWGQVLACALVLGGCTLGLQDLRARPPTRVETFADRQYDVVAGCVVEGLQLGQSTGLVTTSGLVYTVTLRPEQHRATITGFRADMMAPGLDVILVQQGRAVAIESREGEWFGGAGGLTTRALHERLWPIITGCATVATP